jgi:cell division protein FtsB
MPRSKKARVVLPAIRWDRAGRVALLCVLALLLMLYIGPARSYVRALGESKARNAEVSKLESENRSLQARKRALGDDSVLEREARRLGYVRPGERAYVIEDLPD